MPIREYSCRHCGEQTERVELQRVAPPPPAHCGQPMELVFYSKAGFVLRGDGWARDGYAKRRES